MNDPMIFVGIGIAVFLIVAILVMWARFYHKVDQGQALIVNKMRDEPEVFFTGSVVLPIVHRSEVMDISMKTITLERRGKDGLI
jgi:flotillin